MFRLFVHREAHAQLSIILLCGAIFCGQAAAQNRIVGYYAAYNSGLLPYDQVEYSNLTDVIVAFAIPNSDGSISFIDPSMPFPGLVSAAHAAGTKVLISLGGASGGTAFPLVTADSTSRARFINSIIAFLTTNSYDGVDLDWETPADSQETDQLTALVRDMRARFAQTDSSFLITMAIPPGPWGGQHFDIRNLVANVDWFNVMCYDFVGSWSTYAGHNSPLYQAVDDSNQAGSDSLAVAYWIGRGSRSVAIPKDKLVLGVPFYSVQFDAPGLYRMLSNSTTTNPYYPEVMSDLAAGWVYHWDNVSKVPYLTNSSGTEFITFEDTNSIAIKVEFCSRQRLGGLMIWELSQDMYNGHQPLLETLAGKMKTTTAVVAHPVAASQFKLLQNYPNPFNPTTVISYKLLTSSYVTLRVYDALGREVRTLQNGWTNPGTHEIVFDASGFASGIYLCTITSGSFMQTEKMILIR